MTTSLSDPNRRLRLLCLVIGVAAVWLVACSPSRPAGSGQPESSGITPEPTPVDLWEALQERNTYRFTLPLPPPEDSALDGVYVKEEPLELLGEHIHCRRCPDWLYEGGLWKLRFAQGVYRVLHVDLGWKSVGSYVVSADRLILFNDPNCIGDVGVYRWGLKGGTLTFEVIDDPCAILLRGKNLSHLPWESCQPPNLEAAVTDHWQKPEGCG